MCRTAANSDVPAGVDDVTVPTSSIRRTPRASIFARRARRLIGSSHSAAFTDFPNPSRIARNITRAIASD